MKPFVPRVALVALVLACRTRPAYESPRVSLPESYLGAPAGAGSVDEAWWRSLGDPALVALSERALAANLELAQVAARLRAARAELGMVSGEGRGNLDFAAAALRREPSTAVAGGEFLPEDDAAFFAAGLEFSWELDLFGRRARAREAAVAGVEALDAEAAGVELALLAEVARQYVDLRALEREAQLLTQARAFAGQAVELVRAREQAGLADGLERAELEARAEDLEARLAPLAGERRVRLDALALLLGTWPRDVELLLAAFPAGEAQIPAPPEVVASGLPVELLRRRPDLQAAERRVAQAHARGDEARAALYPSLSLGAALGFESESLADLASAPARAMSLGPSLSAPLLSGGVLRWAVRARDAEEEEARLAYEHAVLVALLEVEDGLARFERGQRQLAALEAGRAHSLELVRLARVRAAGGLAEELEVLTRELESLEAEREAALGQAELMRSALRLYRALGGGLGPARS